MLEDADEEDTEVAKVDIERILWLLYRVNALVDVLVLDIEFRQLEFIELELLANGRPLRVLVGDAPRCCCDGDRRSLVRPRNVGADGDCVCIIAGGVAGFNPIIKLVTFVARAEPDVEVEWVLRESDRVPTAASPVLFPKDSFHLLCFFVTTGAEVGTETGGEERSRKD